VSHILQKKPHYHHLLQTIDVMVEHVVNQLETKQDKKITCAKGCSYCCYLFVEISWEEAIILVDWLEAQHPKIRKELIDNIHHNAEQTKKLLSQYKKGAEYMKPYQGTLKIPMQIYDRYFYKNVLPCPFLYEGSCAAYEARPTPCRLHMVTSPSELCQSSVPDDVEGYEVPDEIESLKEQVAPINEAFFQSNTWGHLGIMVQAVIASREQHHQNFTLAHE
jgi:Fe-S-cluster containining protein